MKRVAIAAALILVLSFVGWLLSALFLPGGKEQWQVFAVARGSSMRAVAGQLREVKLLSASGEVAFLAAGGVTGRGRRLQYGRYRFSPTMSAWQMLDYLAAGKVLTERITIPEGFTVRQIGSMLEERGIGASGEFLLLASQARGNLPSPFPRDGGSLEGYLFPDTYEIDGRQGARQVMAKMLARFDEVVWNGLFNSRPDPGKRTLHEIVTLASLVEGEAKLPAERALIAGVLANRLRQGMRLQCDATVQYAQGERKARLSLADLEFPSPYNTYLHAGLPPGPINNPGRASIAAALHPAQTDFLFYVAKSDGSHIFSRTFTEHRAAIRRLRSR